jgi:hypothetical protein
MRAMVGTSNRLLLGVALGPQQFDRRAVDALEQHDLDAALGEREALAVVCHRHHP